jgi:hypothetical protein
MQYQEAVFHTGASDLFPAITEEPRGLKTLSSLTTWRRQVSPLPISNGGFQAAGDFCEVLIDRNEACRLPIPRKQGLCQISLKANGLGESETLIASTENWMGAPKHINASVSDGGC